MRFRFSKHTILMMGTMSFALCLWGNHYFSQPRVWAVSEFPIAFWAWRTNAPSEAEIAKAFTATQSQTLFLRAGQFDLANNSLQRIRPVSGQLPAAVEVHLVYNATRDFLRGWEQLEPSAIAANVADTFRADVGRANKTYIVGLQLDFDAPTRLLPQYASTLKRLRELLPPNTKLSITGLPTWVNSRDLKAVLAAVDFWILQCYGTNIPTHLSQRIPISSPTDVARTISKARQLNKPFYAGLSAYSYAILYAKDGGLLELRGDLDPAWAAHNTSLELIERQTFKGEASTSEMRYVYRAKSDVVLDGLIIKAGESLVFDLPSAASLRASARAVRENAGEQLLGICVFRLPVENDETTLSVGEIAAALNDTPTKVATAITLQRNAHQQLQLRVENIGTASAMLREDALTIDLNVPPGSVSGVTRLAGFRSYETLCRLSDDGEARPCSERRANVIRLKAQAWKPSSISAITLQVKEEIPATMSAVVTTHVNDGRIEQERFALPLQNREGRNE
jgi:Protein of unknown function (DUF3142)